MGLHGLSLLFHSFFFHLTSKCCECLPEHIELTSEESLIYVNLLLLVCQMVDQRQFTVGVEGGIESSRAFLSRLGSHASEHHPPLWMFASAIQLQCANRWHSDKWWLGLIVGFSPCTWVYLSRVRETHCLGQLMFLSEPYSCSAVCVYLCLCLSAHSWVNTVNAQCAVTVSLLSSQPSLHFLLLILQEVWGW